MARPEGIGGQNMQGDPQLFGAMPGNPASAILTVENPTADAGGRVRVDLFLANRRDPMRLTMDALPADRMATAIGYAIPLVLKSHYVNTSQMRRHFWAVWRTVSLGGWEVGITGCGREKSL
jgi:hypothetical protein